MPAGYRPDALQTQFDELTREAEGLVVAATGLEPPVPPGPGDRPARLGPGQRGLHAAPARTDLGALRGAPQAEPLRAVLGALPPQLSGFGRTASGAEVGALLGWMSQRVLASTTSC